ncbi:hypothetical protein ACU684_07195, partial [Pseudomonas sp. LF135]
VLGVVIAQAIEQGRLQAFATGEFSHGSQSPLPLWYAGLSWRAGVPRVGARSGPETCRRGHPVETRCV